MLTKSDLLAYTISNNFKTLFKVLNFLKYFYQNDTGVYCCGPAPRKAIKEGHTYIPHDVPFVLAEVHGDRISWKV